MKSKNKKGYPTKSSPNNHLQAGLYQPSLSQSIDAFRNFMESEGFGSPATIKYDGELHRFWVKGHKKTTQNGYYGLFMHPIPAGYVGDYVSGRYLTWAMKSDKPLNHAQQQELMRVMAEAKAKRNAEQRKKHLEAAKRAGKIWNKSRPLSKDHPYIVRKCMKVEGLREYKGNIVVPLYRQKTIVSLQFISPEKDKKTGRDKTFLKGGSTKSAFYPWNNIFDPEKVFCCEGVATGSAIASMFPRAFIICAMSSSNMFNVGLTARKYFGDSMEIVFCADFDPKDNGSNPGVEGAEKAAKAVNGVVSIPSMPDGSGAACDFNDLYVLALNGGRS